MCANHETNIHYNNTRKLQGGHVADRAWAGFFLLSWRSSPFGALARSCRNLFSVSTCFFRTPILNILLFWRRADPWEVFLNLFSAMHMRQPADVMCLRFYHGMYWGHTVVGRVTALPSLDNVWPQ